MRKSMSSISSLISSLSLWCRNPNDDIKPESEGSCQKHYEEENSDDCWIRIQILGNAAANAGYFTIR